MLKKKGCRVRKLDDKSKEKLLLCRESDVPTNILTILIGLFNYNYDAIYFREYNVFQY